MALKCKVAGHSTTSGKERLEVEDLWRTVCVYYCNRCDDIVVDSNQGSDEEQTRVRQAAETVLESPNQYNEWTVTAAEKVSKTL